MSDLLAGMFKADLVWACPHDGCGWGITDFVLGNTVDEFMERFAPSARNLHLYMDEHLREKHPECAEVRS